MINTYGPEVILVQDHLPLKHRLHLLSLLQPMVVVLREKFIRGCDSAYTPERVYNHTLLLTGDELEAARAKAWQTLNQMAK